MNRFLCFKEVVRLLNECAANLNVTIEPHIKEIDLIAIFSLVTASINKLNLSFNEAETIEKVLKFVAFQQFSDIDFSMEELEKWLQRNNSN